MKTNDLNKLHRVQGSGGKSDLANRLAAVANEFAKEDPQATDQNFDTIYQCYFRPMLAALEEDSDSRATPTPQTNVVSEESGNEPLWIVNDNGELGVVVNERAFFLYKGDNLEYESGNHDDGIPILARRVGKREFGEICHPNAFYEKGWNLKSHYLEPCIAHPGLSFPDPKGLYEWQPLRTLIVSGSETGTVADPSVSLSKEEA